MHHVMGFKEMKLFFHKSIRSSQVHHNNFQFQRKFVNGRVKSTLYQEQHLAKEKNQMLVLKDSQCQLEFSQYDKILSKKYCLNKLAV